MVAEFDDQLSAIGGAFQRAATDVIKVVIVMEWSDGVNRDGVFGAVAIGMPVADSIEGEVLAVDGITVFALLLENLIEDQFA